MAAYDTTQTPSWPREGKTEMGEGSRKRFVFIDFSGMDARGNMTSMGQLVSSYSYNIVADWQWNKVLISYKQLPAVETPTWLSVELHMT